MIGWCCEKEVEYFIAVVSNTMGRALKKLVGQNDSLTGCSAMLRYKNEKLNADISTNLTVLHG